MTALLGLREGGVLLQHVVEAGRRGEPTPWGHNRVVGSSGQRCHVVLDKDAFLQQPLAQPRLREL